MENPSHMARFKILTLNNIAVAALERFPRERYEVASEIQNPHAVLVRSHRMHDWPLPASLRAVGRAGVGVDNIPVDVMSARGIPVFNAPGANANAVKELVLAGMLLAARNIGDAWLFARSLEGDDSTLAQQVEAEKKRFRGVELGGRTLGVVGLGAIGVLVANAAHALGMRVVGFDPNITVSNAWRLSAQTEHARSVGDLLQQSDFISLHVPLTDSTRHLINVERLSRVRPGAVLLNFAREGIVDEAAVHDALSEGRLGCYVCDFLTERLRQNPRVLALPHLGASTVESEENSALAVVQRVRAYLEDGIVTSSVNFPDMDMPRNGGHRLMVVNANVPHMIERISTAVSRENINIVDMLNRSRGELACTLLDIECPVPEPVLSRIREVEGVLAVHPL
jgi:D-3-phosphoglycerate dehydrogenase